MAFRSVFPMLFAATFKWNHGHQQWYENLKLNGSYRHAQFEKDRIQSLREKANVKGFFCLFVFFLSQKKCIKCLPRT